MRPDAGAVEGECVLCGEEDGGEGCELDVEDVSIVLTREGLLFLMD